jgi:hypothetical protein
MHHSFFFLNNILTKVKGGTLLKTKHITSHNKFFSRKKYLGEVSSIIIYISFDSFYKVESLGIIFIPK